MEEESERLKEEERCDAGDMQLLATSPRPGEKTLLFEETRSCFHSHMYNMGTWGCVRQCWSPLCPVRITPVYLHDPMKLGTEGSC